MDTIAGMRTTGRQLRGPASDLVEVEGDNGLRHTAVCFHPQYRSHNGINDALTVVAGFLETPLVAGLMELVAQDPEHGAFCYPTGQVWSVAEVIRLLADNGQTAGIRAGLELMYGCGQVLQEAAEAGEREGVYSHGGLTPWRVMLRRDGQVMLIGYALPQVEILNFREDPSAIPREDSFRYCPPERMRAEPEDLSSDLFGLGLIAFELITGKPVYDGLVNDIRQQAARGEGSRRLFRFRDVLPDEVGRLLSRSMKPEFGDRFADGNEFADAVLRVLNSAAATGPSLMELMERVGGLVPRTGSMPEETGTMVGTRDEFRAMLAEDDTGAVRSSFSPGASARAQPAPPRTAPASAQSSRSTPAPSRTAPPPSRSAPPPAAPPPLAAPLPVAAPASASRPARVAGVRRAPRSAAEPATDGIAGLRQSGVRRSPRRRQPVADAEALPSPPGASGLAGPPPAAGPAPTSSRYARATPRRAPAPAPPSAIEGPRATAPPRASAPPKPGVITPDMLQSMSRPARRAPRSRAPAPAPGESLTESGSASTNDLLARIRASASIPRSATGGISGPPSAGKLINDLLRSSGKSPVPNPTAPDGEGVPRSSGRFGAPDRGHTADPAPAPPPTPPPAAAPPPAPPPVAPALPDSGPTLSPAPSPSSEEKTADRKPVVARPSPPPVPATKQALPAAEPPPSAPVSPAGPGSLSRNPDAIPSNAGKSGSGSFSIRRGPGGRSTRMRLPLGATAAEAVSWIVGNLVPVRTTLSGAVVGWYRFSMGGERVPPARSLAELDQSQELVLEHVGNRTVMALFVIEHGETPTSVMSPVGTAIPVASLTDHLCAWLQLPSGRWRLWLGDQLLDAHGILEDYADGIASASPLQLRLAAETAVKKSASDRS